MTEMQDALWWGVALLAVLAWLRWRGGDVHPLQRDGQAVRESILPPGMVLQPVHTPSMERFSSHLLQAEERHRFALEASGDAWWDWRVDSDRFEFAPRWAQMLGYAGLEPGAQFRHWEALVHQQDRFALHSALKPCLDGDSELFRIEFRARRKDGDYCWILARAKVFERDAQGRALRLVGCFSDIQEQRRAEAALREAEQRWQYALEGSDAGVWDWDLCRGHVYRSARWHEQLGYSRAEVAPTPAAWEALVHPDDLQRVLIERQKHFEGKSPAFCAELRIRRRDGRYVWMQIRARTVTRGSDGEPLRIIGTQTDIGARKQAELERMQLLAERQSMAERLQLQLDCMPIASLILNMDERVEYWNPAAECLFGQAADEAIGRSLPELLSADEQGPLMNELRMRLGGDELTTYGEFDCHARDGRLLHCEWHNTTLRDGGRARVLAMIMDISQKRRVHRQVVQTNAELERRVRERTGELEAANRELEAFSYSVAHDLRAPLRAIEAYTRIMEEEHALNLHPEVMQYFERVRVNSTRMSQLIDDLLALARIGRRALVMQEVDMQQLAAIVLEEVCAAHPSTEIVVGALPTVQGDPVLLHQVLGNLFDNALKFCARAQQPRVSLECESGADEFIFVVRDNGVGFDMDHAQKLFGVFQRLHGMSEYEGTGVGLAIVQRAMQRQRGRVWAEGRSGEGASFYFSLPRLAMGL